MGMVGIDFGTTNSSIARVVDGRVELVQFAAGESSRSILFLERAAHKAAHGGIKSTSGAKAIARYLAVHGEGSAAGRLVQSLKSYLPVQSLTTTEVFGRPYALEDLIARILRDLREAAEAQFGEPVRVATVGRPVKFVGAESEADEVFALGRLREAYGRAGFERVEFEMEPLAAASAYGATLDHVETVLIGDFGGGTSDFSLLRLGPGVREVLGTSGLPYAGDAFDAKLVRHLVAPALGAGSFARGGKMIPAVPAWIYANLERWHYLSFLRTRNVMEILSSAEKRAEDPDRIASLRALVDEDLGYQLHQAVQRVKLALSKDEQAEFVFAGVEAGTLELRTPVSRKEFEQWIGPEVDGIAAAVDGLLESAGCGVGEVDRVFLTGGTSFMPAVRRVFEQRFTGRVRGGGEFTSVASGLALRAG